MQYLQSIFLKSNIIFMITNDKCQQTQQCGDFKYPDKVTFTVFQY